MDIYDRLGVQTLINACGPNTIIGGSIMPPEVVEAMAEASRDFVDIIELNRRAGKIIAELIGAEAAYVTGGASAGVLLATAAVMTGEEPAKVQRLPNSRGMKNQVIVHRSQSHPCHQTVVSAGAQLVEIGNAYRTYPWELETAITDETAGVFYILAPRDLPRGFLPLDDVVRIAHARNVPVYVDAASMLPPPENLRKWTVMGADLVIFSGGKGIMGPQGTGILCGRGDLVEAAALNGSPYDAIGRPAKVSREEMVGLVVALELYLRRDHSADRARWERQARYIADAVAELELSGVTVRIVRDEYVGQVPVVQIVIDGRPSASAEALRERLLGGAPAVATLVVGMPLEKLAVSPHMLRDGEERIVARRLSEELDTLLGARQGDRG